MQENINKLNEDKDLINTTKSKIKRYSKKNILYIAIFILFIILILFYFYVKNKKVDIYIPTDEEKSAAAIETVRITKDIGLPTLKNQIDIINYNSQE